MILTFTKESLEYFETNRVIVDSKNSHPNRKMISGAIITNCSNRMTLHGHGEGEKKGGLVEILQKKRKNSETKSRIEKISMWVQKFSEPPLVYLKNPE